MLKHIQWHQPGTPWGHAPPPWFNKNPNISETIQIPTPKPYIFLFHMLRCIQWHQPGCPWGHATIPSLYKRHMNTGRGLCIALQYYCILFCYLIVCCSPQIWFTLLHSEQSFGCSECYRVNCPALLPIISLDVHENKSSWNSQNASKDTLDLKMNLYKITKSCLY